MPFYNEGEEILKPSSANKICKEKVDEFDRIIRVSI